MTEVPRRIVWLARIGAVVIRTLALTWRVRFANLHVLQDMRNRKQPVIFALWHGNMLPLLWAHRDCGIVVMISEHGDGEIIARIAQSLGFGTVRGSTSRGAARALLSACRELEAGRDLAVTPDGPRGPVHTVAPGTVVIAQRTGAPVLPVVAAVSGGWQLRSWDRFTIPKPFARVTVAYGEPIWVAADTPRDAITETEKVRQGIDAALELAKEA